MGAATAGETPDNTNNVTMNSIDDAPIGVSEDTGGAEMLLGASNDENILSVNSGSFKDLENYINTNKGYGKTIYLNQGYSFNETTDAEYNETGIYLGTYVVIDGQNNVIDAKNTNKIFNIIGQDVVLKNIVFKNTANSAIESNSQFVEIKDCTFDNNTGTAVKLTSNALDNIIDNCIFTNNARGISSSANGAIIRNSEFENNNAGTDNGAAISISSTNNVIDKCIFTNNIASKGGAIYISKQDAVLDIKNSNFTSNSANHGGAIYTVSDYVNTATKNRGSNRNIVNIVNSNFNNNVASIDPVLGKMRTNPYNLTNNIIHDTNHCFDDFSQKINDEIQDNSVITLDKDYTLLNGNIDIFYDGVTIDGQGHTIDANGFSVFYFRAKDFTLKNITIKNAHTEGSGSVIKQDDMGDRYTIEIKDSKFINNSAASSGGVFSFSNYKVSIENSEFINNTARNGGVALGYNTRFTNDNGISGKIQNKNNKFINNSAVNGGVLYVNSASYYLRPSNLTFINNSADNAAIFYAESDSPLAISNSYFENNTALINPLSNQNTWRSDSNKDSNTFINNTKSLDIVDYFVGTDINIPNGVYNLGSIMISVPVGATVNCNGSTFIGTGLNMFSLGENVIFKNFTIINGSIKSTGNVGNISVTNGTFKNSTNPIFITGFFEKGGNINNIKFENCTNLFANSYYGSQNITNIEINSTKYSDTLYPKFINAYSSVPTNESCEDINVDFGEYTSLSTLQIYGNNMVIDGHGSTIISALGNPVFNLKGNNITIKNFKIKNATNPITFPGSHSLSPWTTNHVDNTYFANFENLTFEDCSGYSISALNGNVKDSDFINSGGIVFQSMKDGFTVNHISNVTGCNFTNLVNKRAIQFGECGNVEDCHFKNVSLFGGSGAAITVNKRVNITNSEFINCSAFAGGAIYQKDLEGMVGIVNVSKSTFDGDVAKSSGGAISVQGILILDTCDFNNNTADSSGAIQSSGDLNITNSNFTSNKAVKGGAIVSTADNVNITGCNVSGNTADVGAGISLSGDNVVVDHVNFTDNTASVRGGALMTTGNNTKINNVTATGNSAPSGSAFVLNGAGATLANSTVTNNKGVNGESTAVEVNGENIGILNNTIKGNDGSGVLVVGNKSTIEGNSFNSSSDISLSPNSDIYNNQTILDKLQEENFPAGEVNILNDVDPVIIVSDVNVQQNTLFNITMTNPDFEGNVSVTLNGSVIFNGTFEDIKNNDSIVIGPVLPVAGEKNVTVFFYGDSRFNNKTVTQSFIVSRVTPQMNITVANVTYGNNSTVEVRIGNKANGTITITINDIEITTIPIVNGNATYDLGALTAGNKTANVQFRYNTSDYYNNNVGNDTIFRVDKAESVISIGVNDTYDIGEDVNITVSTTGSSGNLTFKINDTPYPVVNGTVNLTSLELGEYVITATLDADENYTNTTVTKTFNIKKINTDLST